uniref:Putative secreted protein n=1 Tax=Amblyomma cajennense TaxID=34607 RepID=A0A023FB95_AMBCJ
MCAAMVFPGHPNFFILLIARVPWACCRACVQLVHLFSWVPELLCSGKEVPAESGGVSVCVAISHFERACLFCACL